MKSLSRFCGAALMLTCGASFAQSVNPALNDGPYITRTDNGGLNVVWMCENESGAAERQEQVLAAGETTVQPMCGYQYPVTVLDTHEVPEWDFQNVENLAVLSDVHGNYPLMKQLLQVHGVINDQDQWTFGEGHLVVDGDTFSRGTTVTEALWLTYSLQQQAQAVGGRVHMLVGNHESMTMINDVRYTHNKYLNTSLPTLGYANVLGMYGDGTVFGEWLRTIPTIIRINDNLIVHGGISEAFLALDLTIPETNAHINRSLVDMDTRAEREAEPVLAALFGGAVDGASPFWNRQLVQQTVTQEIADMLATHFGTERIIVGHTRLSPPRIEPLYDSRVIAIDAHIQSGNPGQILLIEGTDFWRSDRNGSRERLRVRANRITGVASIEQGGAVTCEEYLVAHGEGTQCEVDVNEGYELTGWSLEGCDASSNTCAVSSVETHTEVVAELRSLAFNIAARAEPVEGGQVQCTAATVLPGGDVSCTASANAGFAFTGWNVAACAGSDLVCEISAINADQQVVASFEESEDGTQPPRRRSSGGSIGFLVLIPALAAATVRRMSLRRA